MKLTTFSCIGLIIFCLSKPAYSQLEISLSTGLEVPQGNMKWAYGPALSYNLSVLKVKNSWKALKGAFGINLGYVSYDSGDEVLYYTTPSEEVGEARFSDYQILMFTANCGWKYEINDLFEASFGWDMGYYYTWFNVSIKEPSRNTGSESIDGKFAFSPRAGLSLFLDDNWGVFVQTRYNFCFRFSDSTTGSINAGGYNGANSGNEDYNGQGDFGALIRQWSSNIGVQYRF